MEGWSRERETNMEGKQRHVGLSRSPLKSSVVGERLSVPLSGSLKKIIKIFQVPDYRLEKRGSVDQEW